MPGKRIAIIGNGHVGSALAQGLTRAGWDVRAVGHDPQAVADAASWGEILILAVPFGAIDETVRELGRAADGKTVVDVTNALTPEMGLALGFSTSGAEELQKKLPRARVAKAFNTVFAHEMSSGRLGSQQLSVFVAADDPGAKSDALDLARALGFDTVDAGPLTAARQLESLGFLNIQLAYKQKLGNQIGFRLLHG